MVRSPAGYSATMSDEEQQQHEHDWQIVNHDENRDIYKCAACGELKRE